MLVSWADCRHHPRGRWKSDRSYSAFSGRARGGHEKVTELIRVDNMHIRKATMFNRADAFVILPGGLGTLEEFFEVVTWKQLQLHQKPIVVLNVAECWSRLTELTSDIVKAGFAHEKIANLFTMVETVDDIFQVISGAPTPGYRSPEDHL